MVATAVCTNRQTAVSLFEVLVLVDYFMKHITSPRLVYIWPGHNVAAELPCIHACCRDVALLLQQDWSEQGGQTS